MTPEYFIQEVYGYYAGATPYSPQQKQAVWNWVQSQYRRDNTILGAIYPELLKTLSPKYKALPAIAELEDALKLVRMAKRTTSMPTNVKQLYPPTEEIASPESIARLFREIKTKLKISLKG